MLICHLINICDLLRGKQLKIYHCGSGSKKNYEDPGIKSTIKQTNGILNFRAEPALNFTANSPGPNLLEAMFAA